MNEQTAHKVYDVLVREVGAPDRDRSRFVTAHTDERSDDIREWRFCGHLGFGGKFWQYRMAVTCYSEDVTPERDQMIARANKALREIEGRK